MKVANINTSAYKHALPQLSPPVIIQYDAYSNELCQEISSAMSNANREQSGVYTTLTSKEVDLRHRSSSYCVLPKALYSKLSKIITDKVNALISHQLPAKLMLGEPLSCLIYDEKNRGHFLDHTDNAYYNAKGEFIYTSPHRVITAVSYMNEDFEGGMITLTSVFNDEGKPISIQPKTGLLLIFPSDLRFRHEVSPVTIGTRYNVVSWFKYN